MYALMNGVPMEVTRLLEHEVECVYDETGCDLLYNRHVVTFESLVGRGAPAYVTVAIGRGGPVADVLRGAANGLGNGIASVGSIRHAVSQPRRAFVLWEVNPIDGLPVILLGSLGIDAANGPRVLNGPSITSIHGSGAIAFMRVTVEVCVQACPAATPTPPRRLPAIREIRTAGATARRAVVPQFVGGDRRRRVVGDGIIPRGDPRWAMVSVGGKPLFTSLRWTQTITYDEDTEDVTYGYVGTAVARRDSLLLLGLTSLDQARGSMLPAVPPNARRSIRQLVVGPDGLTYRFEVEDRISRRNYLDYRIDLDGKFVSGVATPRQVEKISVQASRTLSQPSVGKGVLSGFLSQLQTAQFALGSVDNAAVGLGALFTAAPKLVVAAAATLDNELLPTYSQSAVASVQLNREGKMQDAQALAFALCSGVLDIGTPDAEALGSDQRNRFKFLPPASETTLSWDPLEARVQVSLSLTSTGLLDFLVGQQQAGSRELASPLKDDVAGGQMPFSIFSVIDLLGLATPASILGLGKDLLLKIVKARLTSSQYTGELLVTDADTNLRGPSLDSRSRSASDNVIRVASLLLGPCGVPAPPANNLIPMPRKTRDVEVVAGEERLPPVKTLNELIEGIPKLFR